MEFTLHNVGIVHRATFQLDGLTVLTGTNHVGHTIIPKALYCATALPLSEAERPSVHDALIQSVLGGAYHHPDTAEDRSTLSLTQAKASLDLLVEQGTTTSAQRQGPLPPAALLLPPAALFVLYDELAEQGLSAVPDHWHHALHQLQAPAYHYQHPISQQLEALLRGRLVVDGDRLIFQDQEDGLHPLSTLSEGTVYLSALQGLIAAGALGEGSLLCLEAPEGSLHPEWQLALAPVLTALVQAGVRVLLYTYSLTLLEALKAYSDRDGLEASTHFYWGERLPHGSVFRCINEELDVAFDSFSEPLVQLSRMGW